MSDAYFIAKLVALIFGLIIVFIISYFKGKKEDKKVKGTHIVHENNYKPDSISTNLNKLPHLYFRAIKYTLWGYLLAAIIVSLIVMPIHFLVGLGVLILLVFVQLFSHKKYVKSLIYKGLTIEDQKIIINKYPPHTDQIILFDGIHKITFEDIYQKDRKGFDKKVGCEMIFWNKEDIMIEIFDVEKFKKSEQLKAAIFDRISIS